MRRKSAKGKIELIIRKLKLRYRDQMETSLDHTSPWELLVATMLSAQSQDAQVNKVTPRLFRELPDLQDYVNIRPQQLYPYIKTLGLYKAKAKNIIETSRVIASDFNKQVPSTMEELTSLPGIGRKTANVVLSNAFAKNVGIAIDTHCITVCNRLFLFNTNNAQIIEKKMMEFTPKKEWGNITHLFIALGRDVCTARSKHCEKCVLNKICPSSTVTN